ncbi:MAG TPA: glycosyltransferase family 9 protein [Actinomycetota bacterium]|nr:glycosyltransferase family 9 protein [Actinomycetota bacterium]
MTDPLPEEVRSVAVLRALPGLGDLLCAVPALRALRRAFREARITLIGLDPEARWFVERFRYLDALMALPGYPGLPERAADPNEVVEFLAAAQRRRFDLAVQLHGSGEITNHVIALLGAGAAAGAFVEGRYRPDERRFIEYRDDEPEVVRNVRIVERLGVPPAGLELEFPVHGADEAELERVLGDARPRPGSYAVVHPGASIRDRRWPADRFAEVADVLARHGLEIFVTGGEVERDVAREVRGAMSTRDAVDLSGRTSVGAVAALARDARVVVCNDTGISHLAAALRVPSVVVFTSESDRWAPLDRNLHRLVRDPGGVPVAAVLDELAALLGTPAGSGPR